MLEQNSDTGVESSCRRCGNRGEVLILRGEAALVLCVGLIWLNVCWVAKDDDYLDFVWKLILVGVLLWWILRGGLYTSCPNCDGEIKGRQWRYRDRGLLRIRWVANLERRLVFILLPYYRWLLADVLCEQQPSELIECIRYARGQMGRNLLFWLCLLVNVVLLLAAAMVVWAALLTGVTRFIIAAAILVVPMVVSEVSLVQHFRGKMIAAVKQYHGDHGRCCECGYDLRATESRLCPECGHAIADGRLASEVE